MFEEIVDSVFDITCKEETPGNRYRVYLLTNGTPTLVDTGHEDTAVEVIHNIKKIGVEPERLIVTHADGDHIGGFDELVETYEPETWVPVQSEIDTDVQPDVRYDDGDQIGRFVAVHIPGHELDNYALVDEQAGIAIMGDALSGADHRGFPPGYFHLPPAAYSQDLQIAEENLVKLLDYNFDVGLVFHGASVTEDAHKKLHNYVNFPGKPQ